MRRSIYLLLLLAMPLVFMGSGCAPTLAGESGPPRTYLPLLYSQFTSDLTPAVTATPTPPQPRQPLQR